MTEYVLGKKQDGEGSVLSVSLMTEKEFEETQGQGTREREFLHSFRHLPYCKAEVYQDALAGVLRIPDKKRPEGKPEILGYFIKKESVIFVDHTGRIRQYLRKIQSAEPKGEMGELALLLEVFQHLVDEDLPWLQRFEERITELENVLLEHTPREFPRILMSLRKQIVKLHNFYVQLLDVSEEIQGYAAAWMEADVQVSWRVFNSRVSRLHTYTESIRESLLQLHELYQAQVDIQQNEIMTVLTVVTTIFLPLSLLAGWYGMNFEKIFLLNWKYGYPTVLVLTGLILLLELRYFRKKGFLKKKKEG